MNRAINNRRSGERRRLSADIEVLYTPERDSDGGLVYSYCHHAALGSFGGRLYAMWSNSEVNEDDIGQRVLYSVSDASGGRWSRPTPLFLPWMEEAALTAAGFYASPDGLVAYAGNYRYPRELIENGHCTRLGVRHTGTGLYCRRCSGDFDWSELYDCGIPCVPNQGPQRLRSGKLMICGNVSFPVSDCADGINGWKMRGLSPCPWENMYDDSAGISLHSALRADKKFLCEGSYFQTDDNVIHMLLRSAEGVLYNAESGDDGENWSEPEATAFSDCCSKFHCGRLPDGRFYVINNPDAGNRNPLVLSLSRNGVDFDRQYIIDDAERPMRFSGYGKGGVYGYPNSLVSGGRMYVICSINKEDVFVYSFGLDALS